MPSSGTAVDPEAAEGVMKVASDLIVFFESRLSILGRRG
jgi:hypothetical protein